MHISIPWCEHSLNNFLNISQASNKDSFSPCLDDVILILILAYLTSGKYLTKNLSTKTFHVVMESGSKELANF